MSWLQVDALTGPVKLMTCKGISTSETVGTNVQG